ncbi:MAG: AbrB/MazE/SpoVT family DNA-binding domain-containing protein [Clostridia bacterium]|nr:AbrB/MazE/SpoVT family DNA-binding domain-containing protein [Clostridia bacterium]
MKSQKYIWTTKMGEKGQMVIPKEAREVFNIKSGDILLLFGDTEKGIAIGKREDYLAFAEKIFDSREEKDDTNK